MLVSRQVLFYSLKAKTEETIQILYYIIHPFSKLLVPGLRGSWNTLESQHLRLKALYYIILYYIILYYIILYYIILYIILYYIILYYIINAILYIYIYIYIYNLFSWPFPDCPCPCIATLSDAPTLSKIPPPPPPKKLNNYIYTVAVILN